MDAVASGRHRSGSANDDDTTDHQSYPFKNEVSLSIGTTLDADDDDTPFSTPAHHASSITPSPRMSGKLNASAGSGDTGSDDHHSDDSRSTHVPSPASSSKDSAVLMRRSGTEDLTTAGLDNPGFETEVAAARPLSSFGGGLVASQGNGKGVDKKPVTGMWMENSRKFVFPILLIYPTILTEIASSNRSCQPGAGQSAET